MKRLIVLIGVVILAGAGVTWYAGMLLSKAIDAMSGENAGAVSVAGPLVRPTIPRVPKVPT